MGRAAAGGRAWKRLRIERMHSNAVASAKEYQDAKDQLRRCQAVVQQTQARLGRCREELAYLQDLAAKTSIRSRGGIVTTAHLREKVGHYLHEGNLICLIEEPALTAEIKLPEQEVAEVRPGQEVRLKARALPLRRFHGIVERLAPAASAGALQN